jgi:hypothetical protein
MFLQVQALVDDAMGLPVMPFVPLFVHPPDEGQGQGHGHGLVHLESSPGRCDEGLTALEKVRSNKLEEDACGGSINGNRDSPFGPSTPPPHPTITSMVRQKVGLFPPHFFSHTFLSHFSLAHFILTLFSSLLDLHRDQASSIHITREVTLSVF